MAKPAPAPQPLVFRQEMAGAVRRTVFIGPAWPPKAIIDPLCADHGTVHHRGETIRIVVSNGWAEYRPVEYQNGAMHWHCDLVACALTEVVKGGAKE